MESPTTARASWLDRMLARVEHVGNRLPDPVTLFFILIGLVMVASWLAALAGVQVQHPGTGAMIAAESLFTAENLRRLLVEMPETFAGFAPLGMVLVVMLGIGVADKTGLIAAALQSFITSVPSWMLTAALIFAGIMSSLAVDAGYVVVIPMGAVLFYGAGRHPLAGLAAAFAGVSAGFSANLSITGLDPLLASFTQEAARLLDAGYLVGPEANYWMMVALVPVFVAAGTLITERLVEPRLGRYTGTVDTGDEDVLEIDPALRRKGLRAAGLVLLGTLAGVVALVAGGVLRAEDGGLGPFYQSIVALMVFVFFLPGLAYGLATKQIRSDKDVARMTASTMADMGAYIVLAFAAAHFIALFNWSNLGSIVAISGAHVLEQIGFTGVPLVVTFVIVAAFINLFVGSASAKWAIMAPIFVPMLMLLGYSPELTQAAYRIGDAFTNILTPLLPYFPLIIIFAQKYDRESGLGTLISLMLPYSIGFGLVSIVVLVLWIVFGLPLGPAAPMYYTP